MTQEFVTLPREVVEQALEALNASTPNNNDMGEDWPSHIAARRALRAALEQPDIVIPISVPAGWKLVPVEPTQAMLRAAINAPRTAVYVDSLSAAENLINSTKYRAMLSAAPNPPVAEQPQVEKTPEAYLVRSESRFDGMLFFDRNEAQTYCDEGEEPEPLYAK